MEFFCFWAIIGPIVGAMIGSSRNNTIGGAFLGFFLGPIGWVICIFFDVRPQCPVCQGRLEQRVSVCPHCQTALIQMASDKYIKAPERKRQPQPEDYPTELPPERSDTPQRKREILEEGNFTEFDRLICACGQKVEFPPRLLNSTLVCPSCGTETVATTENCKKLVEVKKQAP
jgi:hypothetical protein